MRPDPLRPSIRMAVLFAALLCMGPALGGVRYLWVDRAGVRRVTHDAPPHGVVFTRLDVPDDLPWRNAPPMPGTLPPTGEPATTEDLYRRLAGSVLWVVAGGGDDHRVQGSAVAIAEDEALTNCHVVYGAEPPIMVGDRTTGESAEAEVVAADLDADRCVVRVRRMTLTPVTGVRPWDDVRVGEATYAIGNPRALERSLSTGLVSGKRQFEGIRLLQTTAPISPGSSGGGLFDAYGNLLGITSSSLRGAQSVNFAIPASDYWR